MIWRKETDGSRPVQAEQVKARPVNFARDVRSILSDNCFACHGPDDKQRKAGLRLDTKEGMLAQAQVRRHGGHSGEARRERPDLPDRDRRCRSQDAPEEIWQAVDGPANRDASPLGRARGVMDHALGVRAAPQARVARGQGGRLATQRRSTASSWPGSRPRGCIPRRRPTRRP